MREKNSTVSEGAHSLDTGLCLGLATQIRPHSIFRAPTELARASISPLVLALFNTAVRTGPIVPSFPSPIVGTGLPGVLIVVAGFIGWRRSRRAHAIAALAAADVGVSLEM